MTRKQLTEKIETQLPKGWRVGEIFYPRWSHDQSENGAYIMGIQAYCQQSKFPFIIMSWYRLKEIPVNSEILIELDGADWILKIKKL